MFSQFLNEIVEKGINVTFSGGKLRYSGPEEFIDDELVDKLKKFKPKLIKYFWPKECWNMMPINADGSKIPLVMLHAGEANYSLSSFLGNDRPFYGFFYIGSEGERIKYKNVESFATEYIKQLKVVIPEGPCILGGFSFGGILAYEMAVRLKKEGYDVPALIMVDCEVPLFDERGKLISTAIGKKKKLKKFLRFVYNIAYYNGRRFFYDFFHMLRINLPIKYRNAYIIWTYSKLVNAYRPREKYSGKMLLFKAEENKSKNKLLGWERFCDDIQLVRLKGSHETMYRGLESTEVLNDKVKDFLDVQLVHLNTTRGR